MTNNKIYKGIDSNTCIAKELNDVFGSEFTNLSKASTYMHKLLKNQNILEQQISCAGTMKVAGSIIVDSECSLKDSMNLDQQYEEITKQISDKKTNSNLFAKLNDVSSDVKLVRKSEKLNSYCVWIHSIQEISEKIALSLGSNQLHLAVEQFSSLKKIAAAVVLSRCSNIKVYACRITWLWHRALLVRLEKEFASILKSLKWPANVTDPSPKPQDFNSDAYQNLSACVEHILAVDLPENVSDLGQSEDLEFSGKSPNYDGSFVHSFNVASVPIKLMIKPLEVRFLYHFGDDKATNSLSNPEWYFSQVLKWIEGGDKFLRDYVQPIMNSAQEDPVNCKQEFIKGLLRLVVVKLCSAFASIEEDDLFSSTIQETLNFHSELCSRFGYPVSQPSVLSVLTQAPVFKSWIDIERKFSLELMDAFVSDPSAWRSENEGEISECGQQIILLLQGITNRYRLLPQPGHRLQFLDLQLELLDDFRVRLLQMIKCELADLFQSNYITILNTVHHVIVILSDWAEIPFFIELHYFKSRLSSAEKCMSALNGNSTDDASQPLYAKESIFEDIVALFSRMECGMKTELHHHVVLEVRAKIHPYCKEKWFITPRDFSSSTYSYELSPSLCILLDVLVKHLILLRKNLAPQLFTNAWKDLADTLDKLIYEEVILQNTFSEFGAGQLNFDMRKALFPIFCEYTSRPEKSFPLVMDSCILLKLPRPTALLLKDSLQMNKRGDTSSPVQCLEELRIGALSSGEALIILNIRKNMVNT